MFIHCVPQKWTVWYFFNNSVKSWSNFNIRVSFKICKFSSFLSKQLFSDIVMFRYTSKPGTAFFKYLNDKNVRYFCFIVDNNEQVPKI